MGAGRGSRRSGRTGSLRLHHHHDHHYVFPRGGNDLLEAEIEAARQLGVRFHPCRGSMDMGQSAGGLPADQLVEDTDEALVRTEEAIKSFHDPAPSSMLRIALAPCTPFTASPRLMPESAQLARRYGVRLHSHVSETVDEEEYCRHRFGVRPVELFASYGWLGPDVWLAHGVHLSEQDMARLADTGTGIACCPSSNLRLASGIAPTRSLLDSGAPVGLGVDGSASKRFEPSPGGGPPGPAGRTGEWLPRGADRPGRPEARYQRWRLPPGAR